MKDYTIVGIHITDRVKNATEVQVLLTQFGFLIRTRLGLHEPLPAVASAAAGDPSGAHQGSGNPGGLILLDVAGADADVESLCDQLRKLHGVQVQRMFFSHPK